MRPDLYFRTSTTDCASVTRTRNSITSIIQLIFLETLAQSTILLTQYFSLLVIIAEFWEVMNLLVRYNWIQCFHILMRYIKTKELFTLSWQSSKAENYDGILQGWCFNNASHCTCKNEIELLCVANGAFDLLNAWRSGNANVNEPHIDCCCGLMPFIMRTC